METIRWCQSAPGRRTFLDPDSPPISLYRVSTEKGAPTRRDDDDYLFQELLDRRSRPGPDRVHIAFSLRRPGRRRAVHSGRRRDCRHLGNRQQRSHLGEFCRQLGGAMLLSVAHAANYDFFSRLALAGLAIPAFSDSANRPEAWTLSSRERQVVQLVAEGLNNREIGDRTF